MSPFPFNTFASPDKISISISFKPNKFNNTGVIITNHKAVLIDIESLNKFPHFAKMIFYVFKQKQMLFLTYNK